MKKGSLEIALGMGTLLLIGVFLFELWQSNPETPPPITNLFEYSKIRNGFKPDSIVMHFPNEIPKNNNADMYYAPGILQGETDFQLLVEFASDSLFNMEKQRLTGIADTSGTFSGLNDSAGIKVYVRDRVTKIPLENYSLIFLFNNKKIKRSSMFHDGAAIHEKSRTILYWFRDV